MNAIQYIEEQEQLCSAEISDIARQLRQTIFTRCDDAGNWDDIREWVVNLKAKHNALQEQLDHWCKEHQRIVKESSDEEVEQSLIA